MRGQSEKARRGAVLLIVLVAMMFATLALTAFIERSSTDLLAEARVQTAHRLRAESYSAMEATLSVLAAFRATLGDLHSPLEGWGDALDFAGYEPESGRRVSVAFSDESGRIPLSKTNFLRLKTVLVAWGMRTYDAERCADALLGWIKEDHLPTTSLAMEEDEYERAPIPYKAPHRVPRSWAELSAIATVRELFFDDMGLPNEYSARMRAAFSLLDYPEPNINAAVPEAFLAEDGFDADAQQRRLRDFLAGRGAWAGRGGGYFTSLEQMTSVLGNPPPGTSFGVSVRALRVTVTVQEGNQVHRLSAVIAPEGGGKAPGTPAEAETTKAAVTLGNLPFAILEIVENDSPTLEVDPYQAPAT